MWQFGSADEKGKLDYMDKSDLRAVTLQTLPFLAGIFVAPITHPNQTSPSVSSPHRRERKF